MCGTITDFAVEKFMEINMELNDSRLFPGFHKVEVIEVSGSSMGWRGGLIMNSSVTSD